MTNLEMVRKLFPEFNWVAKEENGSVFLFKNKPQRAKYTWVNHGKNTSILWRGIDLELGFWRSSLTSIRPETPELVPTEVLDRISVISDQEEGRLEIARKNEDERMEAMRLNLKNNIHALWVNIIGIIATAALMALIIFKEAL